MDLIYRSFGRKNTWNQVSVRQEKIFAKLWFKNTKLWFSKTRNFGFQKHETLVFKNTKFRFENPKFRFEKPEVSVRKPEVSVRKPEVSGKIFELEISVKVVFRNASVAQTRNFELLCRTLNGKKDQNF
jgi:hypothetical protein